MGSEDGFAIKRYHEGQIYDVAESEARYFFGQGWAEPAPLDCEDVKGLENENNTI